ncbi:MAG: sulfatase-like hydrolase/transferase, partial [Erysipelotrichia bacterium]|nr:sulfatase-like hydrolase/transferase [Erysipelotrichia bacterium]
RTSNRHDLAVSPSGITTLDILKDNGYMVSSIGKINDIFNTMGVVKAQKTVSNRDGMNKTIQEAKAHDFAGLCYVNLVEFDSEYGHRRNAAGYAKALEEFDVQLGELLKVVRDDDLVMVTADHGNDPTHHGTDHTREKVPLLIYSKAIKQGRYLDERSSFAVIGATVLENFGLKKTPNQIGEPIMEIFE